MNALHVHRWNATLITTLAAPYLRCACGAWTSQTRVTHDDVKLTPDLVHEMRRRWTDGATIKGMARELGISPSTVRSAVKGKSWADIA